MQKNIIVSAPGSVMLMGVLAVVNGYWAIACAVDKVIEVTLIPRNDRQVLIESAVGNYRGSLDDLVTDTNLSFVLKAIELQLLHLTCGFELQIRAQFSHTLGLGSSAAVTVATIKALTEYSAQALTDLEHLKLALAVVHAVQGRGSGADLAASIYGGVIAYQVSPCQVLKLAGTPALCLHYVGYKTKTPQVLAIVAEKEQRQPALYAEIYRTMDSITQAAIKAFEQQNWPDLGELMNLYQGQMDSLGVNDLALSEMIYTLRLQASKQSSASEPNNIEIHGVKISGSGLGDCVISLGDNVELLGYQQIPISVSTTGVVYHGS